MCKWASVLKNPRHRVEPQTKIANFMWYTFLSYCLFLTPPLTGFHTGSSHLSQTCRIFQSAHLIEIDFFSLLHGIRGHIPNTKLIRAIIRVPSSDNNISTFGIISRVSGLFITLIMRNLYYLFLSWNYLCETYW